jgi:hypothetical protein
MHTQLTNATTSFTSTNKLNIMERKIVKEMSGQALPVQRGTEG